MSAERQESKLIRNLSFWDLMAISVGQIIGAGIMSSTGVAIGMTGTGVVLAFLLSPVLTIISIFPIAIDLFFQTGGPGGGHGRRDSQPSRYRRRPGL